MHHIWPTFLAIGRGFLFAVIAGFVIAVGIASATNAGLSCVVFTTKGAAGPLMTQMRVYGATVLAAEI